MKKYTEYLQIDAFDKIKLIYLAFSFFFIIGSYSILRSLKSSIFIGLVGAEFLPYVKIVSILFLIPVMFLYSKLVDSVRRYQVAMTVILLYATLCIVFSCLLLHPIYGIKNTQADAHRFVGWAFELFMDFYQALVVASFWSFITSISTPEFANKTYGIIYGVSRIGGIFSTLFGLALLTYTSIPEWHAVPLIVFFASILLLLAALCLYQVVRKIPREKLHGYEAAYNASQQLKIENKKPSVWEGVRLMITEPYVMGIFGMVCCFEIINIIFDYKMQILMSIETNNSIHAMSKFMLFYTGSFQALGCIFAFVGTSAFLAFFGVRISVLVLPISTLILAMVLFAHPSLSTVFVIMVILRALNYGFNSPIREVLFIPTVRDIQFKSKAWIDQFGRTISKTSGSTINLVMGGGIQSLLGLGIILTVCGAWMIIAFFVGKKYLNTIAQEDVIGGA